MLISIVNHHAEQALLDVLEQYRGRNAPLGMLYLECFGDGNRPGEEAIVEAVKPLLEDRHATVYCFADGDVVIQWGGTQKAVIDALCKGIYALFARYNSKILHTYYDLQAHSEDLRRLCKHKLASQHPIEKDKDTHAAPLTELPKPTPQQLAVFRTAVKQRSYRTRPEAMIVEDQDFSAKLLMNILERRCHSTAFSGAQEAWAHYLSAAPDIALLDIELPLINGHQLAAAIHAVDPQAFIVMVTANNYAHDVSRAKENGAKGFIIKPYSKQKILESIDKYMQLRPLGAKY